MHLRGSLLGSLAILLLGCDGIAIGDSGEDKEEYPRCSPDGDVGVTDPSAPLEGFERTPEQLVADAETRLGGVLDLADGPAVPVELDLRVSGIVRVISSSDPQHACPPYLQAEATLDIDAGDTLRGVARGQLYIREPLQFRGAWTPLDEFETRLEPAFDAELVRGPDVIADLLREHGEPWIGSLQFAAHVATEPCDETTVMCTGGPGNFTPDYRPLGELDELEPIP